MESLPLIACCAPLGEPALSDADADGLERVFKALADRHRVRILNRLLQAQGEAVCVCDFEELLGLKQPTVSYHLKLLLDAGLRGAREARHLRLLQPRARRLRARPRAARRAGAQPVRVTLESPKGASGSMPSASDSSSAICWARTVCSRGASASLVAGTGMRRSAWSTVAPASEPDHGGARSDASARHLVDVIDHRPWREVAQDRAPRRGHGDRTVEEVGRGEALREQPCRLLHLERALERGAEQEPAAERDGAVALAHAAPRRRAPRRGRRGAPPRPGSACHAPAATGPARAPRRAARRRRAAR